MAAQRRATIIVTAAFVVASTVGAGAAHHHDEAEPLVDVDNHSRSAVEPLSELTNHEALRLDAVSYAADYGVSHDEAFRRLVLQQSFADAVEVMNELLPNTFAGSTIDHGEDFELTVFLKGPEDLARAEAAVPPELARAGLVRIDTTRQLNLPEVERFVANADLSFVEGEVQGVSYDVAAESLVVDVLDVPNVPPTETKVSVRLDTTSERSTITLPVRVESSSEPARDGYRGGVALSSSCTAGFNVTVGGTRGMTTAGHCSNTSSYQDFGTTNWVSMTFQAESRSPTGDVQWHTIPVQPGWAFYGSSTTTTSLVTGRILRSSQSGQYLCHRGSATGYSCGTVTSINFAPSWGGACLGNPCSPTWIRMAGSGLRCYPGDSGGVVFTGGRAAGLYKGQSSSGTTAAACNWMVHMPIDRLSEIGATLLVSP